MNGFTGKVLHVDLSANRLEIEQPDESFYRSYPVYHPKLYEGKPDAPSYKRFLSQIGLTNPQPIKVLNEEKVEFTLKPQYTYSATDTLCLAVAINQYYGQAGWDVETGAPTRETLESVGLGWVADELQLTPSV